MTKVFAGAAQGAVIREETSALLKSAGEALLERDQIEAHFDAVGASLAKSRAYLAAFGRRRRNDIHADEELENAYRAVQSEQRLSNVRCRNLALQIEELARSSQSAGGHRSSNG